MKTKILQLFLGIFVFCAVALPLAAKTQKTDVFLFYSSHCGSCLRLKSEFIPRIMEAYGSTVNLQQINTDEPSGLSVLISLAEKFNRQGSWVPSVLIGEDFLVGGDEIEGNLERLIQEYSRKKNAVPLKLSRASPVHMFKKMSVFTVLGAGLLDGVNPCAFAVIVFFISFLGAYGYRAREIVYIGICYVLSVFITYIFIGVGFFKFLYSLRNFYFFMKLFYYGVAAFCILLALFSLFDYIRFRKTGGADSFILQLPSFLKKHIHTVIGAGLRRRQYAGIVKLCFISLLVGHLVSILEAACTGQVYLPTIAFILRVPALKLKALFYLVLYNMMFVFPLVAVFILSLIGVSSRQFNRFLLNNLGKVKILMVILFASLGIVMLWLA